MCKEERIRQMIDKAIEEKTRELLKGIKEEKSPWISIYDESPDDQCHAICLTKREDFNDIVTVCWYDENSLDFYPCHLSGDLPIRVDYWMPIPKSPEER